MTSIRFFVTNERNHWCREHHRVCFFGDTKHRPAFIDTLRELRRIDALETRAQG